MEKDENPLSVARLLKELSEIQSDGSFVYPKGIFPSQRYHPFLPYRREDDNLFFTVSVVHLLQGCLSRFTEAERENAESVISVALKCHALFKNKDGLDTYNFWQTRPSRHFPNGMLMHRFNHFKIPDDVDDTALVYLTEGADKDRVLQLREKLKLHANLAYKRAFNPLAKYHDLKCYSTFFGEKMYIEFDVCVLSNLMRLILSRLEEHALNDFDKDTLEFICSVIENDEYNKLPFYSAPNYPTTELILYHVARLTSLLPDFYQRRVTEKLKRDIEVRISHSSGMTRILLENAAMKMGMKVNSVPMETNELLNDRQFFFFHAGMITAFENQLAQKLANWSFFHLRCTSKALNGALLIENLILKRSLTP